MKESKTIKKYSDKLLSIANKIRLLGSDFADSRIVEKILRYEASITSLENSKDLSKITLAEVLHALMAQEQRRLMREDCVVEGALPAKHHDAGYNKKKFFKKNQPTRARIQQTTKTKARVKRKVTHLVSIAKKWAILNLDVGGDPTQSAVGEEQLFVATCFAISNSSEKWLIDSGCTNHMTFGRDLFKELDTSIVSKVKIGNGERIVVKGKDISAIENANDNKVFKLEMKGKRFALDPMKEEQKAFSITAIATSSAKPAKSHSVTRPPPSAGVVKDVDRKVIRRSVHKMKNLLVREDENQRKPCRRMEEAKLS
ncbi:hypothetical protein CR513_41344, partial [Mucuna pruriens]